MRQVPLWIATGIALLVSVATGILDASLLSGARISGFWTWLQFMAAAGLLQMIVTLPCIWFVWISGRLLHRAFGAEVQVSSMYVVAVAVPLLLHAVRALPSALPASVGPMSALGLATAAGGAGAILVLAALMIWLFVRWPLGSRLVATASHGALVGFVVAVLCAVVVSVEPRGAASTDGAARSVLLISVDSLRADIFEEFVEKYASETLESFVADSRAYRRAYTTYSHSLPSHASMLTGLYPPEHGAILSVGQVGSPVDPDVESIPERLHAAGYETIGVMSNSWLGPPYGLEAGFGSYFSHGRAIQLSRFDWSMAGSISIVGFYKRWIEVRDALGQLRGDRKRVLQRMHPNSGLFLSWLAARDPSRPFFAFLHYIELHVPHDPSRHFREPFDAGPFANLGGTALGAKVDSGEIPESQMPAVRARLRALNLAMLKQVESFFLPVLEAVESDPRLASTLVIFVSDHGDHLYEKDGKYGHSLVYDSAARVPLVLRAPGATPGWVDDLVSVVDFAPTIYAFTGVDSVERLSGVDLLADRRAPEDWVYAQGVDESNGGWARAVIFGDGLKFIRNEVGGEELFDTSSDPAESRNLAAGEIDLAMRYRDRFDRAVDGMDKADATPIGIDSLPASTREGLRALGYIE